MDDAPNLVVGYIIQKRYLYCVILITTHFYKYLISNHSIFFWSNHRISNSIAIGLRIWIQISNYKCKFITFYHFEKGKCELLWGVVHICTTPITIVVLTRPLPAGTCMYSEEEKEAAGWWQKVNFLKIEKAAQGIYSSSQRD